MGLLILLKPFINLSYLLINYKTWLDCPSLQFLDIPDRLPRGSMFFYCIVVQYFSCQVIWTLHFYSQTIAMLPSYLLCIYAHTFIVYLSFINRHVPEKSHSNFANLSNLIDFNWWQMSECMILVLQSFWSAPTYIVKYYFSGIEVRLFE